MLNFDNLIIELTTRNNIIHLLYLLKNKYGFEIYNCDEIQCLQGIYIKIINKDIIIWFVPYDPITDPEIVITDVEFLRKHKLSKLKCLIKI